MLLLSFSLLLLQVASAAYNPSQAPFLPNDGRTITPNNASIVNNANHIFTAIHSAMRQWGSSLKHNGMSFFPATVPKGTLLYHGAGTAERVTGMEWLAFEIEHATMFAWKRVGGGRGPDQPPPEIKPGYIHVYQANRPLKLLYIDGMAAAKSLLGTLDTQDKLLLDGTNIQTHDDYSRGRSLCEWGSKWNIDGIIRMEGGFEIIYCDFSDGLDFVSHNRVSAFRSRVFSLFEYVRSVSMRYAGIGASRVSLDYSSMVSVYYFETNLTNPDPSMDIPRLTYLSPSDLSSIRIEVEKLFDRPQPHLSIDWQGVVDLVVTRYSDRLQYLATGPSYDQLLAAIGTLLNLYIDYGAPWNETAALESCTLHYLQPVSLSTSQDTQIYIAVSTVTARICSTLFEVRKLLLSDQDSGMDHEEIVTKAVNMTKELIAWLDWSTWTTCGQCQYEEVCFVAFFPYGSSEDHYHPRCRNRTAMTERNNFGNWWRYNFSEQDRDSVEQSIQSLFY
ncbi:hypothetical protein B7463_g6130, partial [Scytalidium lignicola]